MSDAVEDGWPGRPSSQSANERVAIAMVAEPIEEKARGDDTHRTRVEEHTANGTFSEIRETLAGRGRPRN